MHARSPPWRVPSRARPGPVVAQLGNGRAVSCALSVHADGDGEGDNPLLQVREEYTRQQLWPAVPVAAIRITTYEAIYKPQTERTQQQHRPRTQSKHTKNSNARTRGHGKRIITQQLCYHIHDTR